MASLQPDLADDQLLLPPAGLEGASVKLNRRSVGGLAFDIQFEGEASSAAAASAETTGGGDGGHTRSNSGKPRGPPAVAAAGDGQPLTSEEIAERLAAAERRREQQLAQRIGAESAKVSEAQARRKRIEEERLEQFNQKTVEETLKAAEERRLGIVEEMKQRVRGLSANFKERSEALKEQQEAARLLLEAGLEKDIRDKEARRKELLDKVVHGVQQHLAKVEGVRLQQRPSGGAGGGSDAPEPAETEQLPAE